MAKFRLLHGTDHRGDRRYNWSDPNNNVVECEENLAALDPRKWQRIEDESTYEWNPVANRVGTKALSDEEKLKKGIMPGLREEEPKAAHATATHAPAHAPAHAKKGIEDKYGALDEKTVQELKEIADAEGIDVKAHTKKEDIVKSLRAK